MLPAAVAFSGGALLRKSFSEVPIPKLHRSKDKRGSFKLSVRIVSAAAPALEAPGFVSRRRPYLEIFFGKAQKATELADFVGGGDGSAPGETVGACGSDFPWRFGDVLTFVVSHEDVAKTSLQLQLHVHKDIVLGPVTLELARVETLGEGTVDLQHRVIPSCIGQQGRSGGWESPILLVPLSRVPGSKSSFEHGFGEAAHVALAFSMDTDPEETLEALQAAPAGLASRAKHWIGLDSGARESGSEDEGCPSPGLGRALRRRPSRSAPGQEEAAEEDLQLPPPPSTPLEAPQWDFGGQLLRLGQLLSPTAEAAAQGPPAEGARAAAEAAPLTAAYGQRARRCTAPAQLSAPPGQIGGAQQMTAPTFWQPPHGFPHPTAGQQPPCVAAPPAGWCSEVVPPTHSAVSLQATPLPARAATFNVAAGPAALSLEQEVPWGAAQAHEPQLLPRPKALARESPHFPWPKAAAAAPPRDHDGGLPRPGSSGAGPARAAPPQAAAPPPSARRQRPVRFAEAADYIEPPPPEGAAAAPPREDAQPTWAQWRGPLPNAGTANQRPAAEDMHVSFAAEAEMVQEFFSDIYGVFRQKVEDVVDSLASRYEGEESEAETEIWGDEEGMAMAGSGFKGGTMFAH